MSLVDAFVLEPFTVDDPLLDSFLLEPDQFEFWIALRTDAHAGSGTEDDPYDGGSPTVFDNLMNSFPPRTTVRLGPGTFQTQGHYDGIPAGQGWQPKSGMRILGSATDVTTLKLVNTSATTQGVYATANGLPAASPLVTGGSTPVQPRSTSAPKPPRRESNWRT